MTYEERYAALRDAYSAVQDLPANDAGSPLVVRVLLRIEDAMWDLLDEDQNS